MKPAVVSINEVVTRDGFQIEQRWVPTDEKVALINRISCTGVSRIEVSSFVSPAAVPNLRDAADVFATIARNPAVTYVALVPNIRGFERALAAHVNEVNLVMSASETHNRANMGMNCAASLDGFARICTRRGSDGPKINGTIATAFGCPFEGPQSETRVLSLIEHYLNLGMNSITLADTTGIADPRQVASLVTRTIQQFPAAPLTLHFHNTRGMGLANILAAYDAGARSFDGSIGGIGGCPFAPSASGNVCTEDVVHMFSRMSVETGVNLDMLIEISSTLPQLIGHDTPGQIVKAGASARRFPAPALVREGAAR